MCNGIRNYMYAHEAAGLLTKNQAYEYSDIVRKTPCASRNLSLTLNLSFRTYVDSKDDIVKIYNRF